MSVDEIRTAVPSVPSSKVRVMLAALKRDGLMRERHGAKYEVRPQLLTASVRSKAVAVGAA